MKLLVKLGGTLLDRPRRGIALAAQIVEARAARRRNRRWCTAAASR